ncbi:MAG: hypothetical protein WC942_02435, partial [Clostridia bacterium]
ALTGCDVIVPAGTGVKFENDSTGTEYEVISRTTGGGTNAVFQIDLDSSASGSYTLVFNGQSTNPIPFDAEMALIKLELEALDGIGKGDVLVEAGSDITITFQDDLAATNISTTQFTFVKGDLDGTSPEMTRTVVGVPDGSTLTITLASGLVEEITAGGNVTFVGRRLEVKIGEGNLVYRELKTREYMLDRGRLSGVRDADEAPVEVSFEFVWEWITGVGLSGVPTLDDVLKQKGEAANWVSSDTDDPCNPYAVDIVMFYQPACGESSSQEKITLKHFRWEELDHNLRDSQISCSGKCNITEAQVERS